MATVPSRGKQLPKPPHDNNDNNNNDNNNAICNMRQTRAMRTHAPSKDLSQFEDPITESDASALEVPENATRFMKRNPPGKRGHYCKNNISITMIKVSSPESVVRSNHPPHEEHLVRNDRLRFPKTKSKVTKDNKRKAIASDTLTLKERKKAALEKEVELLEKTNELKEREHKVWTKELEKREAQVDTNE